MSQHTFLFGKIGDGNVFRVLIAGIFQLIAVVLVLHHIGTIEWE